MMRLGRVALALVLLTGAAPQTKIVERSPSFELNLPTAYQAVDSKEEPRSWRRPAGPEAWAQVTFRLGTAAGPMAQPAGAPTIEGLRPLAALPKVARPLFVQTRWKNFDLGAFEYKAVVKDLPVFGLTTAVPVEDSAVLLTVEAPEPLEKEVREDFRAILASLQGSTLWVTEEEQRRERSALWIEGGGLGVLGLYAIAWVFFFRGDLLRAHWARTIWLAVAGVALFVPLTMTSDMSIRRLSLSLMLPMALFGLAARRIKLAIDLGE